MLVGAFLRFCLENGSGHFHCQGSTVAKHWRAILWASWLPWFQDCTLKMALVFLISKGSRVARNWCVILKASLFIQLHMLVGAHFWDPAHKTSIIILISRVPGLPHDGVLNPQDHLELLFSRSEFEDQMPGNLYYHGSRVVGYWSVIIKASLSNCWWGHFLYPALIGNRNHHLQGVRVTRYLCIILRASWASFQDYILTMALGISCLGLPDTDI